MSVVCEIDLILKKFRSVVGMASTNCKIMVLQQRDRKHRRLLKAELPRALNSGDVYVVHQPKFALSENTYNGVETLLRWNHPTLGQLDPGSVVAMAETSGQIHDLTLWVLGRAIADQQTILTTYGPLPFHINVSGKSLANDEFINQACSMVTAACGSVGFEITETAFIADPVRALANLNRLVAAGIKVSIDDYGSGHSSLAYLKQLPADELKIDRLFVSGMTRSHRDPLIVRSTIDLAHALGMRVVAEGVESQATLALLRMMGCDVAQGYLISPALPVAELASFIGNAENLARLSDTKISLTPERAFWNRTDQKRKTGSGDVAASE